MMGVVRNDANQNRVSILRAAGESLLGASPAVPALHQEAVHRTGLARATVYRHFPDQRSLAEATLGGFLRLMEGGAAEGSLREVLTTLLRYQVAMRPATSLVKVLPAAVGERFVQRIVTALTPLFEAAQARGEIRPGLTPADLETIMRMLEAAAVSAPDPGRFVDVLVDGLFVRPDIVGESHLSRKP